MFRFIVELDQDPTAANYYGETPFDLAPTDEIFYALEAIDLAYFMIQEAAQPDNCDAIKGFIEDGSDVLLRDTSFDNFNFVHYLVWNDDAQCIADTLDLITDAEVKKRLLKMENFEGFNALTMTYYYEAIECEAAILKEAQALGIVDELEGKK